MHILILHYTLHTACFTIASDCTEHFPHLCTAMCIITLYKCTSCSLASTISTGLKCNSLNTAHCLCHWIGCNADETPAMYSSKTNIASLTQVRVSSLLLIYVYCTICALLSIEKTQPWTPSDQPYPNALVSLRHSHLDNWQWALEQTRVCIK